MLRGCWRALGSGWLVGEGRVGNREVEIADLRREDHSAEGGGAARLSKALRG